MVTPYNTFTNLQDWLNQVLPWLHADGLPDVLQKPHSQLLNMMLKAKDDNRANDVWDLIDKLERLALRTGDTREQGEIYIHCAKMGADMANLKDALRLFQAAESKYLAFPHQHAVVLWMVGCIHWIIGEKVEGISTWQAAISLFNERKLNVQVDSEKAQWYIDRMSQLEEALAKAISTDTLPACELSETTETAQKVNTQPFPEQLYFEGDSLRWVSCQVSESIPAGGFGPTGNDPNPIGFLEITEILIEDEPYQAYSVRRTSTRRTFVNINSQLQYRTVHVTGTSMNAAKPIPIEPGDYILIVSQPDGEDNEIVVAGIVGQNERSSLKRLRRRNGKIQLIPESTDPTNYELDWEKEFDEFDDELKIIGVVKAVFKKKC